MELVWLGIAFVGGLALKSVGLPTLIGYLTAGLVLSLFDVGATDALAQIGDLGVMLLLFTVGLHLRLKSILRPEVLGTSGIHLLISTGLFAGLLLLFDLNGPTLFFVAISLGFSSTVLTAKTLESRQELGTYHGRVAIGILIVQDIVAVVLLAFTGSEAPTIWAVALIALPLLRPVLIRLMVWSGREELLLLFGLLLTLGAGFLFQQVGLSDKLGALAAGVLLTGHPRSDELYEKLWGLKEVFLVGFFLQVGLVGLPTLSEMGIAALLLLVLPIKALLFFGLLLLFKLRARTAFMSTIALTAYSEFALIVGSAAATAGLLGNEWVLVLALLTAVSYALNAPISRAANSLWSRWELKLVRFERTAEHPDHDPASFGRASYLILGMGKAGEAAYDAFVAQGARPLGLDADPAQIEAQLARGRRVIFGDAQDPELWHNVSLGGIQAVIMTLPNVEAKMRSAHVLREAGFDRTIAALIRSADDEPLLRAAGVSGVVVPITEAGRDLAQMSLQQTAPV